MEILGHHWPTVAREGQDRPSQTGAQIGKIAREREDGHDFASDRDLPLGLARDPVRYSAKANRGVAEGPVGDVHHVSTNAEARLCAAPIAWVSPVRWRLKSSIGITWE